MHEAGSAAVRPESAAEHTHTYTHPHTVDFNVWCAQIARVDRRWSLWGRAGGPLASASAVRPCGCVCAFACVSGSTGGHDCAIYLKMHFNRFGLPTLYAICPHMREPGWEKIRETATATHVERERLLNGKCGLFECSDINCSMCITCGTCICEAICCCTEMKLQLNLRLFGICTRESSKDK